MGQCFSEKQQTGGEEIPYLLPKRPEGQCTYNETVGRFQVTIITVEKL